MPSTTPNRIAIIGAGLTGLTLAIALRRQGISCTLFELREPTVTTPGALMLSPNALRILDTLGLYTRLSRQGYNFEEMSFKNEVEITTDTYYLGDAKLYGYKALRIYRQDLLTELRAEVEMLGIKVQYGHKFSHVISEDDGGVAFAFTDGTQSSADILVGADGIHSTVRKYVAPDVVPKYSGLVAITCAVQKSQLDFTNEREFRQPVAIRGKQGAFIMAPQNVNGSEFLAGTQRAYPEQDRAGWDALLADKDKLLTLFRTGYEDWSPTVRSALDNVSHNKMAIWPYYVMPKLDSWCSFGKKVIIVGDAAHAIPPTAGQGASQGFEDAITLAALLPQVGPQVSLAKALTHWKDMRQERVDRVIALTLLLNNARLPQVEREKLGEDQAWRSGSAGELGWLYNCKAQDEILAWVKTEKGHGHTCPISWFASQFQFASK